jgi:hypothetical protein
MDPFGYFQAAAASSGAGFVGGPRRQMQDDPLPSPVDEHYDLRVVRNMARVMREQGMRRYQADVEALNVARAVHGAEDWDSDGEFVERELDFSQPTQNSVEAQAVGEFVWGEPRSPETEWQADWDSDEECPSTIAYWPNAKRQRMAY